MRRLLALLLVATAWSAEPAPATATATQGTGPTAGERFTRASLSADDTWARARLQAQNEQRLRQARAANQSALAQQGDALRTPEPTSPGGLAALVEGDEIALLLELQRRRRDSAVGSAADLVAAELAAALTDTPAHTRPTPLTPQEPTDRAHPADEPHPGPHPPAASRLPERPDQLPGR